MDLYGSNSANWSMINSSHTTTWSEQGDDLSFYLWATNHTATFRLSTSNACGGVSYDYTFVAENCGGDGGPCDTNYTVYPNPTTSNINIHPNLPAPCPPGMEGSGTASNGSTATLYDFNGNPVLSQNPAAGVMNVATLAPGQYILIITDANGRKVHRVVVQ